ATNSVQARSVCLPSVQHWCRPCLSLAHGGDTRAFFSSCSPTSSARNLRLTVWAPFAMEKVAEAVEELQAAIKDQEACLKRKRETLDEQLDHLFKKPKSKEVKASDVIKLNVGGDTGFVTKRDTLTAVQGSRLAEMFSDRWDPFLARDSEGRIFLDLDPVQFRALLNWLVDVKRSPPGSETTAPCVDALPVEFRPGFLELCDFLCSRAGLQDGSAEIASEDATHGSALLSADDAMTLTTWISAGGDAAVHLKLLYRASRDGFSAQAFHQKCDAHGPAVVIARSQAGYIFGGYTDTAFDSSGGYRQCSRSFLFHLSGPSGYGPSKHVMFQNQQHGIYCSANHAATFGGGHDMRIFPADAAARVAFCLGNTYQATGTDFNDSFLAEGPEAVVTEWEVFQIQNNGEGAQLLCLKNYLEDKVAEWQEQEQAKEWSVVNKLLQVMNSG
ncbi:unnamed protein product, partial [Effrenium voratum]